MPAIAVAERRARAAMLRAAGADAVDCTIGMGVPSPAWADASEAAIAAMAALAVKGAEQILRKEVNAGVHADLLNRLKTEL